MMTIHLDSSGRHPVAKIEGELSIYTAEQLKTPLYALLQQHTELELDLSAVSEIDGAGLQILIAAKREAYRQGLALKLTRHSAAVLEVFDLCNMAQFFGDPLILSEPRRD
jgi:anti-sigma B factor antagonist